MVKKVGRRLRELAFLVRGSQETESRNLWLAFSFTSTALMLKVLFQIARMVSQQINYARSMYEERTQAVIEDDFEQEE